MDTIVRLRPLCSATTPCFTRCVCLGAIALVILGAVPASSAPPPPKFFGFVSGFRFDCDLAPLPITKAVTNMTTAGAGSLCPLVSCTGTSVYGLDASLLAPLGPRLPHHVDAGQWGKLDNTPPAHIVAVNPEETSLSGHATFRPGKWMVLSGTGTMYHINRFPPDPCEFGTPGCPYLPPSPCNVSWTFAGQRRNTPPSGPRGTAWILRGFIQQQASSVAGFPIVAGNAVEAATPPLWVAVTPCAKQTACLGAPGSNRADLLIRTLPLSGGRQTPAWLPLTTAGIDVWSRRVGETNADARAWTIPAAGTELDRPGFLDLLGYTSSSPATTESEFWEQTEAPLMEFNSDLTNIVSEAGPPPPSGPWLTTPTLPGFRFKGLLAGAALLKANACPAQTLCFAKTATGVPELVARILPKQANGKRWPVVGKFASQAAQVWIEQIASKQVRYYELLARAADSPELPGVVDRVGFAP